MQKMRNLNKLIPILHALIKNNLSQFALLNKFQARMIAYSATCQIIRQLLMMGDTIHHLFSSKSEINIRENSEGSDVFITGYDCKRFQNKIHTLIVFIFNLTS